MGRQRQRAFRRYERASLGCVLLGEQVVGSDCHRVGIGHVVERVGEGEAHTLDQVMEGVRALKAHAAEVEPLGYAQREERVHALGGRRTLPAVETSVVGVNWIDPRRFVRGHVVGGKPTADGLHEVAYLLGKRPLVEGVAAAFGDRSERLGQGGNLHNLAGGGRRAVQKQLVTGGASRQSRSASVPVVADDLRDGEPMLGVLDRGLQRVRQVHTAVTFEQRLPAAHGSRDGHRKRTLVGDASESHATELLKRRLAWRPPAGVESVQPFVFRRPDQGEQVSPDAGRVRLDNVERGGGCYGSVNGVAAPHKRSQARGGGERLRGGDHSVPGADVRSARCEVHFSFPLQGSCGVSEKLSRYR